MRRRSRFHGGFTLVETALAIGIVAMVVVSIVGIMPVALTELGRSRDAVVISELAEAEIAKAARMDFSRIGALDGREAWFDVSGIELQEGERGTKACYVIRVQTNSAGAGVAFVTVSIYRHPRRDTDNPLDEFKSLLANNGR